MVDRIPDQRDARPAGQPARRVSELHDETSAADNVGAVPLGRWTDTALRRTRVASPGFRGGRHPSFAKRRDKSCRQAARLLQEFSLRTLLVRREWLLSMRGYTCR